MQTVISVVVVAIIAFMFFGSVYVLNTQTYPRAMRVQNDAPFYLLAGQWTPCPNTTWITPGDGVSYEDGRIYIDKKFEGALITVNIESQHPVHLRFVGYDETFASFVQELGVIDRLGSSLWQVQPINEYYAIELLSDVDTEVKMCRLGVQVNR